MQPTLCSPAYEPPTTAYKALKYAVPYSIPADAPPQYPRGSQPQYPPYVSPYDHTELDPKAARAPIHQVPRALVYDQTSSDLDRLELVRATYIHLFAALLGLGGLYYLLTTNTTVITHVSAPVFELVAKLGDWSWAVVVGALVVVGVIADLWAPRVERKPAQYAGFLLFFTIETMLFVPLLAIVIPKTQALLESGLYVRDVGFIALCAFAMLTASVLLMRRRFAYWKAAALIAFGVAGAMAALWQTFTLGIACAGGAMFVLATYMLVQTRDVLSRFGPRQYVSAAVALFASIAIVPWYLLRIAVRR